MPGYIASDREIAARNGEDAIVEYLLLRRCFYLVHNGSGLARTVLLAQPKLAHFNVHLRNMALVDRLRRYAHDRKIARQHYRAG
jgi:hypothetical protein